MARLFPAYGYSVDPDVLWDWNGTRYVLELKCACKNEPLVLAQVLHAAQVLEDLGHVAKPVRPVLVTMYNAWLRAAVARCRAAGLVLDALEMDLLEDQSAVWFDDPHASWRASEPPAIVPATHREGWRWHAVDETRSWIAVRSSMVRRPVFFTEPYVMVAQVFDEAGSALDEYVLWQGTPPAPRTSSSPDVWADAAFYRWTASSGGAELPAPPA